MKETKTTLLASKILSYVVITILVLMPFHAILTVGLSQVMNNYTALRLWKEVLLAFSVGFAAYILVKNPELLRTLLRSVFVKLSLAYLALVTIWTIIPYLTSAVTAKAAGYGLISDVRFVIFCLVCLVAARSSLWLHTNRYILLLGPASIVVLFGLLQQFALPHDALKHIGYGTDTIRPYQRIDQKDEYVRIISTLRGANPLGAYVLTVLSVLTVLLRKRLVLVSIASILSMSVLFASQSRSAWIGLVLAWGILLFLLIPRQYLRSVMVVAAVSAIVVAGGIYIARDNDFIQNTVFHTDESSQSATSSNETRLSAIQSGLRDIGREPLGRGVGTAGPASVYNGDKPGRLAENYYLQIGQEMGILGLVLFMALSSVVAIDLFRTYRIRNDPFALALLASFLGLALVNMLNHAWADDTLAYVWWGLAGITLAPSSLMSGISSKIKDPQKQNVEKHT